MGGASNENETSYTPEAVIAMFTFSLASSSLLLINKFALYYIPMPSFVSTLQFVASTITAVTLMAANAVPTDRFEWRKVKPYLLYVCMFVTTIYCNMKALQHSNVETIIVFRACCPLVVSLIEWGFMGRRLPSARSCAALMLLLGGCVGYVLTDRAFKMNGLSAYTWVTAYFIIISVEMAYGKHIVGPHLGFASMWGPTLYTNTISIPPMAAIGLLTGEQHRAGSVEWSGLAVGLLLASCVVGVAISFLGFRARSLVTATCYTVLGVANKMLTVLGNALIWDQHASLTGICCLVVCLIGATGYKQAPMAEEMEPQSPGRKQRLVVGWSIGGVLFLFATLFALNHAAAGAAPTASPPSPAPPPAVPGHHGHPHHGLRHGHSHSHGGHSHATRDAPVKGHSHAPAKPMSRPQPKTKQAARAEIMAAASAEGTR